MSTPVALVTYYEGQEVVVGEAVIQLNGKITTDVTDMEVTRKILIHKASGFTILNKESLNGQE